MDYDDKQRRDTVTDLSNLGKIKSSLTVKKVWPKTTNPDSRCRQHHLPKGPSRGTLQATILPYTQVGSQVVAAHEEKTANKLTTEMWDLRTPSLGTTCTTATLPTLFLKLISLKAVCVLEHSPPPTQT